ncbi:hypothetical protein ACFOY4_35780 [Actinomadura syzygii]|uniref:hypothetical protein n=1 Tax=Actinomadura syzygii TaxID=1427538 RepID=UPI001CA31AB8|nr:hypothetical protein [Actinomadura syzygii]
MVGLVAAALGAGAAVAFWDTVRTEVMNWLRARNLDKGALLEAVIVLDRVAVGIRRRVVVRTAAVPETVSEETLTLDQIDDPQVRALLEQHDQVNIDFLQDL